MELSSKQQTVEQIKKAKKILAITHISPDGDALGSLLALSIVLKKLGKDVTFVCPDIVPLLWKFLPSSKEVSSSFNTIKDLIITLDTQTTQVAKLSYKKDETEKKLNIIITPEKGGFEQKDISFSSGGFGFDLIIILDSPDFDRLDALYNQARDLFYETVTINIDHHAANDNYGKINWVELTATSTAEILVALFEALGRDSNLIDADVATCLLCGIITDTGSFRNTNTTPKSLTVAAQLVAAGGRQQEIIQAIYKTRSLSTLKLWGRVLSNLKEEKEAKFIYSVLSKADFTETGAVETESSGVIDELLKTAPEIDFALLLVEKNNGLHGSLRAVRKSFDVSAVAGLFAGGGHPQAAAFDLPGATLAEKQAEIIEKISNHQKSH